MTTLILIERQQKASFADSLNKRYAVVSVASGKQAIAAAQTEPTAPTAVILDAISMKTSGERIARQIKAEVMDTPLIHLHPGPKEAVNSPADSVLIAPLTARKLALAVARFARPAPVTERDTLLNCGPFSMNLNRRTLTYNGQEMPLSPKLALLVEYFLRHPGETLDRKQLMEQIWHTDYMGDTRTLDVHIRWFRRAIEGDPHATVSLVTVRKVGYRLEIPAAEPIVTHAPHAEFHVDVLHSV
ncbi:MAG: response regulator transcription factor [bacterium]|nr:response regulator transcription factor [bacterium]